MPKLSELDSSQRRLFKSTRFSRLYSDQCYVIKSIAKDFTVPPHNHRVELAVLSRLSKHENPFIIKLLDSKIVDDELELLFPRYKSDLHEFMRRCFKVSSVAAKRSNPYYTLSNETAIPIRGSFKNRFDVNKYAFDFTLQLSQGLQFLHSQKVIHRDIKPQNILVDHKDGIRLIITDFGISYDNEDSAQGREEPVDNKITDVSTSIYKAPELLFGVKNYSYAVDIWALMVLISQWFQEEAFNPSQHIPAIFDDGSGRLNENESGSDIKLILSIFSQFGIPSLEQWPEVAHYGSTDAFCGMFGSHGDGHYILNETHEVKLKKINLLLPRLHEMLDNEQKTALISCILGMVSFESSNRWSSERIVQRLMS